MAVLLWDALSNAGTVGTENQRQRALASAMSLRMNLDPIIVWCGLVAVIICSALAYSFAASWPTSVAASEPSFVAALS
jgi:hypothetical protein